MEKNQDSTSKCNTTRAVAHELELPEVVFATAYANPPLLFETSNPIHPTESKKGEDLPDENVKEEIAPESMQKKAAPAVVNEIQLPVQNIKEEKEKEEEPKDSISVDLIFADVPIEPPSDEDSGENGAAGSGGSGGDDDDPIQKKEDSNDNATHTSSTSSSIPENVQSKMEQSFGHDFSSVKIHANSSQAENNNALAYAQGSNIHFAPGQFNPNSLSGQELLGHELAHIVQQREGRVIPTKMVNGLAVNDDPGLEAEADEMGADAANYSGIVQNKKASSQNSDLSNASVQFKSDPLQMNPDEEEPQPIPDTAVIRTGSTNIVPENNNYEISGKYREIVNLLAQAGEDGSISTSFSDIGTTSADGTNVNLNLTVTIVKSMPVWTDLPNVVALANDENEPNQAYYQRIVTAWTEFYTALDAHEEGHKTIDQNHFNNCHTRLIGKTIGEMDAELAAIETDAEALHEAFHTAHGSQELISDVQRPYEVTADESDDDEDSVQYKNSSPKVQLTTYEPNRIAQFENKGPKVNGGFKISEEGVEVSLSVTPEKAIKLSYAEITFSTPLTAKGELKLKGGESKKGGSAENGTDGSASIKARLEGYREEAVKKGSTELADMVYSKVKEEGGFDIVSADIVGGLDYTEEEGNPEASPNIGVVLKLRNGNKITTSLNLFKFSSDDKSGPSLSSDYEFTFPSFKVWENNIAELNITADTKFKVDIKPNWSKIIFHLGKSQGRKAIAARLMGMMSMSSVFLAGIAVHIFSFYKMIETIQGIKNAAKNARIASGSYVSGFLEDIGVKKYKTYKKDFEFYLKGGVDGNKALFQQVRRIQSHHYFSQYNFTSAELVPEIKKQCNKNASDLNTSISGKARAMIYPQFVNQYYKVRAAEWLTSEYTAYLDAKYVAHRLNLDESVIKRINGKGETAQGKFTQPLQKAKSDSENPTVQNNFESKQLTPPKQLSASAQFSGGGSEESIMPGDIIQKMEASFGTSFSNVNIHENSSKATEAGAIAYAQGNDVHFAPGQFKPNTQSGQELIGHELTHVVQQRQGRVKPTIQHKGMDVNDDPGLEKEADEMGAKAASGSQLKLNVGDTETGNNSSFQLKVVIQRSSEEDDADRRVQNLYRDFASNADHTETILNNLRTGSDTLRGLIAFKYNKQHQRLYGTLRKALKREFDVSRGLVRAYALLNNPYEEGYYVEIAKAILPDATSENLWTVLNEIPSNDFGNEVRDEIYFKYNETYYDVGWPTLEADLVSEFSFEDETRKAYLQLDHGITDAEKIYFATSGVGTTEKEVINLVQTNWEKGPAKFTEFIDDWDGYVKGSRKWRHPGVWKPTQDWADGASMKAWIIGELDWDIIDFDGEWREREMVIAIFNSHEGIASGNGSTDKIEDHQLTAAMSMLRTSVEGWSSEPEYAYRQLRNIRGIWEAKIARANSNNESNEETHSVSEAWNQAREECKKICYNEYESESDERKTCHLILFSPRGALEGEISQEPNPDGAIPTLQLNLANELHIAMVALDHEKCVQLITKAWQQGKIDSVKSELGNELKDHNNQVIRRAYSPDNISNISVIGFGYEYKQIEPLLKTGQLTPRWRGARRLKHEIDHDASASQAKKALDLLSQNNISAVLRNETINYFVGHFLAGYDLPLEGRQINQGEPFEKEKAFLFLIKQRFGKTQTWFDFQDLLLPTEDIDEMIRRGEGRIEELGPDTNMYFLAEIWGSITGEAQTQATIEQLRTLKNLKDASGASYEEIKAIGHLMGSEDFNALINREYQEFNQKVREVRDLKLAIGDTIATAAEIAIEAVIAIITAGTASGPLIASLTATITGILMREAMGGDDYDAISDQNLQAIAMAFANFGAGKVSGRLIGTFVSPEDIQRMSRANLFFKEAIEGGLTQIQTTMAETALTGELPTTEQIISRAASTFGGAAGGVSSEAIRSSLQLNGRDITSLLSNIQISMASGITSSLTETGLGLLGSENLSGAEIASIFTQNLGTSVLKSTVDGFSNFAQGHVERGREEETRRSAEEALEEILDTDNASEGARRRHRGIFDDNSPLDSGDFDKAFLRADRNELRSLLTALPENDSRRSDIASHLNASDRHINDLIAADSIQDPTEKRNRSEELDRITAEMMLRSSELLNRLNPNDVIENDALIHIDSDHSDPHEASRNTDEGTTLLHPHEIDEIENNANLDDGSIHLENEELGDQGPVVPSSPNADGNGLEHENNMRGFNLAEGENYTNSSNKEFLKHLLEIRAHEIQRIIDSDHESEHNYGSELENITNLILNLENSTGDTDSEAIGAARNHLTEVRDIRRSEPSEELHIEGAQIQDPENEDGRIFSESRANSLYTLNQHDDHTREMSLYKNLLTGEFFLARGDGQTALNPSNNGLWKLMRHSHPIDPETGETSIANHFPSGGDGDFGVLMSESFYHFATPEGTSSIIDIVGREGPAETHFSFDPNSERPYTITINVPYPILEEKDIVQRVEQNKFSFRSLDSYHEFMENHFDIILPEIPPHIRVLEQTASNLRAAAQREETESSDLWDDETLPGFNPLIEENTVIDEQPTLDNTNEGTTLLHPHEIDEVENDALMHNDSDHSEPHEDNRNPDEGTTLLHHHEIDVIENDALMHNDSDHSDPQEDNRNPDEGTTFLHPHEIDEIENNALLENDPDPITRAEGFVAQHRDSLETGSETHMLGLLRTHGTWRDLMIHLNNDTNNSVIILKLQAYRNRISQHINTEFHARIPHATENPESDIDISMLGDNAGASLLEAEQYMVHVYGENWESILRMNFYTDPKRHEIMSQVESIMDPGSLRSHNEELSDLTEVLSIVQMLEFSQGDQVSHDFSDGMHERLSSEQRARVQELLSQSPEQREDQRRELHLRVDELAAQYRNAEGSNNSEAQAELARQISILQTRLNFLSGEAYIGAGATRAIVSREMTDDHGTYQYGISQLPMLMHIINDSGGHVEAARKYEFWKYVKRYCDACDRAGIENPSINYFRGLAIHIDRQYREGMAEDSHTEEAMSRAISASLQDHLSGLPVTDEHLEIQINDFLAAVDQTLPELREQTQGQVVQPKIAHGEGNIANDKSEASSAQIPSNVNLVTNSSQATEMNALAFAQGSDIHFAPGQFKPDTQSGQELIGHELHHVKQQKEGRVNPTKNQGGFNINDDHRLENEADNAGKEFADNQNGSPFQLKSENNHNSAEATDNNAVPFQINSNNRKSKNQEELSPFKV